MIGEEMHVCPLYEDVQCWSWQWVFCAILIIYIMATANAIPVWMYVIVWIDDDISAVQGN